MSLEKLTDNVEIHQTLGDTPNSEGMTAADLKEKFDLAAKIIKQFINDRIVPNALDKRGDTMKGNLSMGGNRIAGLPEPTSGTDAANKAYVDNGLAGRYPAIESAEHPGCYYNVVDGVTEWLNPPALIGVEYRTTKRYNGKVVYEKAILLGEPPSDAAKFISHWATVTNILEHYAWGVKFENGVVGSAISQDHSYMPVVTVESSRFIVKTGGVPGYTLYGRFEYTKD